MHQLLRNASDVHARASETPRRALGRRLHVVQAGDLLAEPEMMEKTMTI